jgi:hypothetical protein
MQKTWLEDIRSWLRIKKNRIFALAFVIMALLVGITSLGQKAEMQSSPESADTVIPAGYVLVPIQLENQDSISSLMGEYGVVNLFLSAKITGHSQIKVGQHLKLLRAPLNPDQYAVLVPEEESGKILEAQGPFFAVLQNPNESKATNWTKKKKTVSRIEYLENSKGETP